jgi:hypothetical protein
MPQHQPSDLILEPVVIHQPGDLIQNTSQGFFSPASGIRIPPGKIIFVWVLFIPN